MKLHSTTHSTILACCDEGLLGKTLRHQGVDVEIRASFYGNEKTGEEKFVEAFGEADNVNLFGEEVVALALKRGLIKESDVLSVAGVPHAIIYRM